MDKTQATQAVLAESRNGVNQLFRHALNRNLRFSDGVKSLADAAGAYWLIDIVATECAVRYVQDLKKDKAPGCALVEVKVNGKTAELAMTYADDAPPIWKRKIAYTDLPLGFTLALGADVDTDREGYADPATYAANLILISEY